MTQARTNQCRTVQVALPVPTRHTYTYLIPDETPLAEPGCRVRVPFGRQRLLGIVVDEPAPKVLPEGLKPVQSVIDEKPFLPRDVLAFSSWLADYYLAPLGMVLRCAYPSSLDPSKDSGKDEMIRRRAGRDRVALLCSRDDAAALLKDEGVAAPFRKVIGELLSLSEKGYPEASLLAKLAKVPQYTLQEMAEAKLIELFSDIPTCLPGRPPSFELSSDQKQALEAVAEPLRERRHRTFLLYGITGSGKTEVYLNLMEMALEAGGTALYMVPEISLTSLLARRLLERLGGRVAILHSSMSDKERARQWLRAREGSARVMIGPRSALFAPLPGLRLIVVDEEHDPSYKQQESPRYHARDMAVLRGMQASIPVVLGSATPSVESYYNAAEGGKYTLIELSERAGGASLPTVEIVDMRKEYEETNSRDVLSRVLCKSIEETLAQKRQAIILRNRTGFATFVLCRRCGKSVQCPDCAVSMTHHMKARNLRCHYCGRTASIPAVCPSCGGEFLQFLGAGSEKVEEIIKERFPQARIARMDRDAVRTGEAYDRLWLDFERGAIDILVGTQMVAKGNDVHNVTLAGIISADFILQMPDFRSAERAFQLITQAAGRSGRGGHSGRVVLQSFHPDHYAVQAAAAQDFPLFYQRDIRYRKMVGYPPFTAIARVEIRHKDHAKCGALSTEAAALLRHQAHGEVKVLGPSPAFIPRIESFYRHQILLKSPTRSRLKSLLQAFLESPATSRHARAIDVEVDPVSLL